MLLYNTVETALKQLCETQPHWRTRDGWANVYTLLCESMVGAEDLDVVGCPEDRRPLLILAAMLGPTRQAWPIPDVPGAVLDALASLHARLAKQHPKMPSMERVWEATVAFGAGYGRESIQASDDVDAAWLGVWPQARAAIAESLVGYERLVLKAIERMGVVGLSVHRRVAEESGGSDSLTIALAHHSDLLSWAMVSPEESWPIDSGETLWIESDDDGPHVAVGTHRQPRDRLNYARQALAVAGEKITIVKQPAGNATTIKTSAHLAVSLNDLDQLQCTVDGRSNHTADPQIPEWLEVRNVQSARVARCSCGGRLCKENHRVDSWKLDAPFGRFLWEAVTGGDIRYRMNSLKSGMYLPLLIDGGGLIRPVATVATPATGPNGERIENAPPTPGKGRLIAVGDDGWQRRWYGVCTEGHLLEMTSLRDEFFGMLKRLAAPAMTTEAPPEGMVEILAALRRSDQISPAAVRSIKQALDALATPEGMAMDSRMASQRCLTALRSLRRAPAERSDLCKKPSCMKAGGQCELKQNPMSAWRYDFARMELTDGDMSHLSTFSDE